MYEINTDKCKYWLLTEVELFSIQYLHYNCGQSSQGTFKPCVVCLIFSLMLTKSILIHRLLRFKHLPRGVTGQRHNPGAIRSNSYHAIRLRWAEGSASRLRTSSGSVGGDRMVGERQHGRPNSLFPNITKMCLLKSR